MSDLATPVWPYLVGDIHGCFSEYLELEALIFRHAEKNQVRALIVSVGDLIDRGPDSASVVAHFLQGQQKGTHEAILGNHEVMLLQVLHHLAPWNFEAEGCHFPLWLSTLEELYAQGDGLAATMDWDNYQVTIPHLWLSQGGWQTLQSYDMDPANPASWCFSPFVVQYLVSLPLYWESELGVATHALAQPEDLRLVKSAMSGELSLSGQQVQAVKQAVHSLLWRRDLPTGRPDPQRLHVSGHTPMSHVRRWRLLQCTQIDTGCVYGRSLSAYCLPRDKVLAVLAARNYLQPA
ncbi:MAG: metallophosphoesterase [Candidatus Sericytochromatia bacterium]|nr:metallophosphoesterase [Candidatus Sericytochromatia bacterium]